MTVRTLLYGADGTPAVTDMDQGDKLRALLVESFGAILGLQEQGEWQKVQGGPGKAKHLLLSRIAETVGCDALNARYIAYGLDVRPAQPKDAAEVAATAEALAPAPVLPFPGPKGAA